MSGRWFFALAFGVVAVVAGVVSFFASPHPDGLAYIADNLGFLDAAQTSSTAGSPLANYSVAGVPPVLATGIAGLVGAAVVGGLTIVVYALVTRRRGAGARSDT